MTIPSEHFRMVALLSEISLQCSLIEHAGRCLQKSAQHWIKNFEGVDDGGKAPPIEIIASCSVLLSAAAIIRKYIDPGARRVKQQFVVDRCEKLMKLLGSPDLPVIMSTDVRNSWEHIDERVDKWFSNRPTGAGLSEIHISEKAPKDGVFVLRHFDPRSMSITHHEDKPVNIPLIISEVEELSRRIDDAFNFLRGGSLPENQFGPRFLL